MLILDTHVWIWLINGNEKLKESGLLTPINREVRESSIFIPAISMWEVAMLTEKNRISLSENTLDWIRNALTAPGLTLCPITPEIAYESSVLPGDFHGDPADRLIVASARVMDAALLTFDKLILKYAKNGHVKFIDPH